MMSNMNPTTQSMDIAARIRGMRDILGYSTQKMAELTEVTEDIYRQYETGTVDLPFTFLHKCAKVFGVEITVLLEGHSAKLSGYTITRLYSHPSWQGSGYGQRGWHYHSGCCTHVPQKAGNSLLGYL